MSDPIPCKLCIVFPLCKANNMTFLNVKEKSDNTGTEIKTDLLLVGRLIEMCPNMRDWYYTHSEKDNRGIQLRKTFSVDHLSWV